MASKVFFIDLRASAKENFITKLGRLTDLSGLRDIVSDNDLTAIKLHFGESGNTSFIRPIFIKKIVEMVKKAGGRPFLVDTNTLYAGSRRDSQRHIKTAIENGFAYSVVNAPVIIADGLRGKNEEKVSINGKHFKEVFLASDIIDSDSIVSVAHFKGHELTGFGGALKNLGMGCASRKGKLIQHSTVAPMITKKCIGCRTCTLKCPGNAITVNENKKAVLDSKKCVGCGECIIICPMEAIKINWNQDVSLLIEYMVEHAAGVIASKPGKILFVNFICDISPSCDCADFNDAPIVRNIGVAASYDPVAIDQVCLDLVNGEPGLSGSCVDGIVAGEDKFKVVHPQTKGELQLIHGELLGIGSRQYELIAI